jgi:hypothetical protein
MKAFEEKELKIGIRRARGINPSERGASIKMDLARPLLRL